MVKTNQYQILVVDDDAAIVNILETSLKQAGYSVMTADNGSTACCMADRMHPHLIIMDVMMPQCNGIMATMRIREQSNVPILMLSAKAEGSDRVLGLAAAENAERPGRYLVFQVTWSAVFLAVCAGAVFLVYQGNLWFLPWIVCFPAVVLSCSCFLRGIGDVDHLSAQIHRIHEGQAVSVKKGLFEKEEEKLLDLIYQRDEAVETAVTSERFKVDLISNVSHDLRTPLTAILGYGELLKKEQLSVEGNWQLAELNQKAGYMRELVDSLFELTKVSSGAKEAFCILKGYRRYFYD